ncbi:MAG TPA: type II toxin-antitoxin system VapC family toxin [Microlunatus sp.]
MTIYLDTSAAAKLLVEEPESAGLAAFLDSLETEEHIMSSSLLETELRRLGTRLVVPQSAVTDLLARIGLIEPDRSLFYEAGLLPGPHLRSLDALHLATAVRVDADAVVAYDRRLLEAARSLGLDTVSP